MSTSGLTSLIQWWTVAGIADMLGNPVDAQIYVLEHVKYSPDRFRPGRRPADVWLYPLETLRRGRGDCDDIAILLCSLLRAMGYTAYVRVGEFRDGSRHAWVSYYCSARGRFVGLDATSWDLVGVDVNELYEGLGVELIVEFNDEAVYVHDYEKFMDILGYVKMDGLKILE